MKERKIKRYIWDLSKELAKNLDEPRWSMVFFVLKHFQEIPNQRLYKYRVCNQNNFSALEKNSIYLSRASEFPDVFDSKLFYNFEKLSKRQKYKLVQTLRLGEYSKAYLENHWDKINGTFHPRLVKDFLEQCYDNDFYLQEKKLLKFVQRNFSYNQQEVYFDFLRLDEIFARDGRGEEVFKWIVEKEKKDSIWISEEQQKETFVCSLTEDGSNASMWENYADNYSGFCIEYSFESVGVNHIKNNLLRTCLSQLVPMIYTDKTHFINGYDFMIEQNRMMYQEGCGEQREKFDLFYYYTIFTLLLTKKKDYEWEREWRIVLHNLDKQVVYFPFATGIYLGKKIKEKHKSRLLKIAEKLNLNVYQQEMKAGESKYTYTLLRERKAVNDGFEATHIVIGNPKL